MRRCSQTIHANEGKANTRILGDWYSMRVGVVGPGSPLPWGQYTHMGYISRICEPNTQACWTARAIQSACHFFARLLQPTEFGVSLGFSKEDKSVLSITCRWLDSKSSGWISAARRRVLVGMSARCAQGHFGERRENLRDSTSLHHVCSVARGRRASLNPAFRCPPEVRGATSRWMLEVAQRPTISAKMRMRLVDHFLAEKLQGRSLVAPRQAQRIVPGAVNQVTQQVSAGQVQKCRRIIRERRDKKEDLAATAHFLHSGDSKVDCINVAAQCFCQGFT